MPRTSDDYNDDDRAHVDGEPGVRCVMCNVCRNAEPFRGWDECLSCGTASLLVEDPDYIDFARRVYHDDTEWLAALEAEWSRQRTALMGSSFIRLAIRQAG